MVYDSGFGYGDSFISIPTIMKLKEEGYLVRLITQSKNTPIFDLLPPDTFEVICDMNSQQRFYTHDFDIALNGLYWWANGRVCNFGENVMNYFYHWNGLDGNLDGELFKIDIPKEEIAKADLLIEEKSGGKPVIVFQTLMSFWNKMINYETWNDAINKLKEDFCILQIGAPMRFNGTVNLCGKTSIRESIALAKQSDVLMGGDSWLNHASGFLKKAGVFTWTSTSPEDYGYCWNRNIWHPEVADCLPCGRPYRWMYDYNYKRPDSWERDDAGWCCPDKFCAKAITPEEIVEQIYNCYDEQKYATTNFSFKDYKKEEDQYIKSIVQIKENDPKVSFVVVTYDKLDKLDEVIKGIGDNCPYEYEIILVDNGDKGLQDYLKIPEKHMNKNGLYEWEKSNIKVLGYTSNLGYSGGNNAGIEFSNSKHDYFVIVNPDLIIKDENCIKRLIQYAGKDCISGKLVGTNDWYTYPASFPTYKIAGEIPFFYDTPTHNMPGWMPMPYIDGSLMCFSRKIYEDTGGFDTNLPEKVYFDEAPLLFKAFLKGYQIRDARIDGFFDHKHTDYDIGNVANWTKNNRQYFYEEYALKNWSLFLSYLAGDCIKNSKLNK